MFGMGRKATIALTGGSTLFALGLVAIAISWWHGVAIVGLSLLWLTLTTVTYQQQRLTGALRRLRKRVTSIEQRVVAAHETERQTRKRTLGRHLKLIRGAISARLDGMEADLTSASRNLDEAARSLLEAASPELTDRQTIDGIVARIETCAESIDDAHSLTAEQRPHHELVTQIDAMLQLHRRFPMDGQVPLMWGWALSPRGLLQVVDLAVEGCDLVVEFGAGTSTIYLGRALREAGRGRLVAIEHLPEIADHVQANVRRHGLEDIVDVRLAELTYHEIRGNTYHWYDTQQLDDLHDIDLLIVDGPPARKGILTRFPAVDVLGSKLRSGAYVVLDDAQRDEERQIADQWLRDDRLTQLRSATREQYVFRWSNSNEFEPTADTTHAAAP